MCHYVRLRFNPFPNKQHEFFFFFEVLLLDYKKDTWRWVTSRRVGPSGTQLNTSGQWL